MSDDQITTSVDIQNKYQKLYVFLMEYLWDYKVVEALANLEISCYKTFPDKDEMLKYLNELRRGIQATYNELSEDDEPEFEKAYTALEDAINSYVPETALVELYSVADPLVLSDIEKDTKEVFKAGDIQLHQKSENDEIEENDEVIEEDEQSTEIVNPFEEE